jgi:hypothetical protein
MEKPMTRELHADDRLAIGETLSLHGHLFDAGLLDRLAEIFTPDVVYDMSSVGIGTFEGSRRSGAPPCTSARATRSPIT